MAGQTTRRNMSAFLAGIALAAILAFWLTSSPAKTTTTTFQALIVITPSTVSTTSATTTTTVTTTASTTLPTCASSFTGSTGVMYNTMSGNQTSYTCHAYTWTSSVTGLVTLAFQLRHDPVYWYLDDVSITDGNTQLLSNGGFETGSLSPWIHTLPNGNCVGSLAQVVNVPQVHTGTYCVSDGSNGCADQISQQFNVSVGRNYTLSFWLKSGSTGSVISALVTIS